MGKVLLPRKRPERKLDASVRTPITFNNPQKKQLRTQVVRETTLGGRMVTKALNSRPRNYYPLSHEQPKKLISERITTYEKSRCIHNKNNTFADDVSTLTLRKFGNFSAYSLSISPNQEEIKINADLGSESDEIDPFWRGVFVVPHQPKILFSQEEIELKPNKSSTWKRHVVIDISRIEDDDE